MNTGTLLRYFVFVVATLIVLPLSPTVAAAQLSMGEAINKAGRQRMLSQRIVKAYALVGQKVMMSAAGQLDSAIALFESQLQELTDFAKTEEEKESIAQVTELWTSYKALAQTQPNQANALKLTALSENVLKEAHRFVGLLEKRSGTSAGRLVNIAGRQRMLSQRIAKFYVLRSWGLNDPAFETGYDQAVEQFTVALAELKKAPENTSDINTALAKVEEDWNVFKISKKVRGGKHIPSLVVRQLDKILGQMNYITALYAAVHK